MPRNQNRMGDTSISINSQLDRLEKISDQISRLISSGDYNKICHLDRIRKKIINDMNEKNHSFNSIEKKSVLSLISKNEKIISEFKSKETQSLAELRNKQKCSQAYLATF